MKKQLLLLLMMLSPMMALAYDAEIDGIYYDFEGTEATVVKGDNQYTGDIVIPESITYNETEYSVVCIGDYAFSDCSDLTSISMPNSVTCIGIRAFCLCEGLTSITFPEKVTNIGDEAFYNCHSLTSITIPIYVTSIGNYAFHGCSGLFSITIPERVTSIGDYAFMDCSSLTSIVVDGNNTVYDSRNECNAIIETESNTIICGCSNTIIPESVTSIGNGAFSDCRDLISIIIPESVTSIGDFAFNCCYNLASINIPESVKIIGNRAFSFCHGLTSIIIPESVTSIGENAFYCCGGLTSIVVDGSNTVYDSRNGCNAIIETAPNTLILGCSNTIIPESVTSIGDYAFYGSYSLSSITIPESVTSIGNRAFYNCNSLSSITIPESVNSIGSQAFYACYVLTSIIIPESVKSIGSEAFEGTPWLDNQPDGLVYAGLVAYKYKGTMPENSTIEIKDGTLGIAGMAFSNCTGLTSIGFPNSVTNIGDGAFYECQNLTSIIIPNKVTSIGEGTFNGCQNLTSIIIPNKVTSIGEGAFYNCQSLNSIIIPEGVKSIETQTFWNCSSLISITIPESVTQIGDNAFFDCRSLTSIAIPKNVSSIGGSAFWGCTSLSSISIPEGVTCIGSLAFYDCNGLTSIKIPESVTEIGYRAFFTFSPLSAVKVGMRDPVTLLPETFWGNPILYVPYGSKAAYLSAEYWQDFSEIVECNYPEVEHQTIAAGNSTTMGIGVNNFETNLVGLQMDLMLPEGVAIDKTGCSLSSRITDNEQELTIGKLESGAYRITSTSLSLTPISGNDGTLLSLKLTAEDGCIGGQATISNIIFSTAESEKVVMSDKTFDISILYNLTYKVDGEEYTTSSVVYGTALTPEEEPTKEGYTFGGWSEMPETMPNHNVEITGNFYLYGDVNTDDGVDVVDVVDIARFVVATPSVNFREKLADLNFDNTVNIADAVTLVNYIAGDQNFARATESYDYSQCQLQLLNNGTNALSFCITGDADFTAFQFEVELPENTDITAMRINGQRMNEHQLIYNKVADNRYRVAVLSLSNAVFNGNEGELLSISIDGQPTNEICISKILFVTKNGTSITFDDISLSEATGITNVNINDGKDVVFDLQGRKLSKVQRGVNIVNGKKVAVK